MALIQSQYSYIHFAGFRTVFYGLFALLLLISSAGAQEANPYTIENIRVDVSAANAVEARTQAFDAAQVKGYEALAKRLLPPEEAQNFVTPDLNTVSSYVMDYEVSDEKLSATRYSATYKIRYSKKAFKNYAGVASSAIPPLTTKGDTLVLPFLQSGQMTFLWQANPFMKAWTRAQNANQAGNAIVPVGDIDDVTQIREQQGLNYDPARLNAMRDRYHANKVVVMVTGYKTAPTKIGQGEMPGEMIVQLYEANPYGPTLTRTISVVPYAGEVEDQLYNRIVAQIIPLLGKASTVQQAVPVAIDTPVITGAENNITAQLNFSSVREWIDIKKTIESVPAVRQVNVSSLSPRMATLNIKFNGTVENLNNAFKQKGVILTAPQVGGGIYQITRGTAGAVY